MPQEINQDSVDNPSVQKLVNQLLQQHDGDKNVEV